MQLDRNFTTAKDIQRVEEDVAWYKKSIGRYQEIARKDKDGIVELIQLLKDAQLQAQMLLDAYLKKPTPDTSMFPPVYSAEVRVYSFVLDLLENPKKMIEDNRQKMAELEKHLSELRKLPRRD